MTDGDDEIWSDEDVQLGELHRLRPVQVASRAQHHEEGIAVALQLRALMGEDGILDRELVQPELLGDAGELILVGPVETDPCHPARPGAL